MSRALLRLVCGLALMCAAFAQTATDPNEGARLTRNASNNGYTFFW